MFCCPECFCDSFLKDHIKTNSEKKGNCDYCLSESDFLIPPEQLTDRFDPLISFYIQDENGFELLDIIKRDWNIFSEFDQTNQTELLLAISGKPGLLGWKYSNGSEEDTSNLTKWENFRIELKHNNRFFPDHAPNREHLEKIVGFLLKETIKGEHYYRARTNNSAQKYGVNEMGKPDTGHSTNGRANPIGIPYLYVASDAKTAIAELRPNKGEKLTVAKFIVMEDMKFADLCDPKVSISPFQLNDDNELEQIYKNRPFLVRLSEELSKPIIPDDSKLEYLPTQYLCELVKQFGYNGIIYKSSVSKGKNLVIFNDEKLQCIECDEYRITDTEVMSEKIK